MKVPQVVVTLLTLFLLSASFHQAVVATADEEAEGEDVLDLSGDGMTVKQPTFDEPLPEGWTPTKDIGADLACSACEIIVDRLQSQQRTAEHAAKEATKKERKLAEEEKKESGDEEKKEEGNEKEKEEEKKDADDKSSDAKKDDKKKKKKDKKKNDKKSKKKKEDDIKINKAEVAEFVVNQACNHTYFSGMSKIGSYPGRKYSWSSYDLKSLNPQVQRDITNICKHLFKDEDAKAYVVKALAGSGKSKVKRMKRNLCERRAKVCKSAALGYEAESACVMKSMRAFDKGDYEKAKQYAADCGATTV